MSQTLIYVGPSVGGLLNNSVFKDGVPSSLSSVVSQYPDISLLLVPISTASSVLSAINIAGTPENQAYRNLASLIGAKPPNPGGGNGNGNGNGNGGDAQQVVLQQPVIREPFSGSNTMTKTFESVMNGFGISNDGDADITFTIGGVTLTVKGSPWNETFEGYFDPFSSVTITSNGVPFRAYGLYSGTTAPTQPSTTPDTTAPSNPTNLAASGISATALTLSWTAATDNVGITGYEVYNVSTLIGTTSSTSYNVTGLTASTQYTFTVKAKDAAGNKSSGASVPVTTSAAVDNTAPSDVTNLTATPSQSSVSLSWSAATDNVGVSGYDVYNGTTLITSVTGTTYNVTGLSPSTQYTFKVKAKDAAGNASAGATVTTSTTAPADTTAPTVTASPAGGTFTSSQSVTLSANEQATIYYTLDGSTPTTSSSVYSGPITVSATTTLKFFGKDTAGNSSTVQTQTYTITAAPENALDYDSFTRADSATSMGSTEVGGRIWKYYGTGVWGISGNAATLKSNADSRKNVAAVDLGFSDFEMEVTFNKVKVGSSFGLAFRYGADTSDPTKGYQVYVLSTDNTYIITKNTNTIIAQSTVVAALNDKVVVRCIGNTITLFINDVQIAQATDTTYAGTNHGLWSYAYNSQFDAITFRSV